MHDGLPLSGIDLSDSGRVKSLIHPVAQKILYSGDFETLRRDELEWMTQIDLAHLVMLQTVEILPQKVTAPLIQAIQKLRDMKFEPLRARPAPRGTYMLYESYLIEHLGSGIGGSLQTARSRNDLNATLQRMRHRIALADLLDKVMELETTLMDRAQEYLVEPFPMFTHYQAAQVTTLAHYFLAVVTSLQRGHFAIEDQFTHLTICPLGAGAIAGTGFPINTDLTAQLLGFEVGPKSSIDAIASRDHVQRTLNECGILGTIISRLAHDLQLWTTQDFGLLKVNDTFVGISSMMPQKRNIYLTEYVKGKLATVQGAMQSAAMALHSTPFTNSIAVGTEASKHLWPALKDTGDALQLISLLASDVVPVKERCLKRISDGFCTATALADGLVRYADLSFRDAHHCVGRLIYDMQNANLTDMQEGLKRFRPDFGYVLDHLDLSTQGVISAQKYGGGPALEVQEKLLEKVRKEHDRLQKILQERREVWTQASIELKARTEICVQGST